MLGLLCLLTAGRGQVFSMDHLPADCRQCIVVTAKSWDATAGELRLFARAAEKEWRPQSNVVPVRLGRSGVAWGRGLLDSSGMSGPRKREGDNKAPAGVFQLGTAFGYAQHAPPTTWSYLPLTSSIVAVDDPESRHYNQLIDTKTISSRDWKTAENMILPDIRYKWGIVVNHNQPPVPGDGSCIFLHVWKDPQTSTTGCTAMPEQALLDLLKWLQPEAHPLLVQMPASLYEQLRNRWGLPELVTRPDPQ
jgi:L,D-peptidoglycan transpeptidase YkuD (ErfK/YbiS/YcfS/YnhG family)